MDPITALLLSAKAVVKAAGNYLGPDQIGTAVGFFLQNPGNDQGQADVIRPVTLGDYTANTAVVITDLVTNMFLNLQANLKDAGFDPTKFQKDSSWDQNTTFRDLEHAVLVAYFQ